MISLPISVDANEFTIYAKALTKSQMNPTYNAIPTKAKIKLRRVSNNDISV